MPGSWAHLAARFFDVVSAAPLTSVEQAQVDRYLRPPEADSYRAQTAADQRHGLESALHVESRRPDRPDLVRAALLHDIGKHTARLGPLSRTLASIAIRLGASVGGRWGAYRDHGPIGAELLESLGAEELVVVFARHHHSARPTQIPVDEWELLVDADHARIRRSRGRIGYAGRHRRVGREPSS